MSDHTHSSDHTPGTAEPEQGSITRTLEIEASPETVYEVISQPGHMAKWWPEQADFTSQAGETGTLVFGESCGCGQAETVPLTIVEADPHRRFSFRWVYDESPAAPGNSLLVTFDIAPRRGAQASTVTMTESGFRERGWSEAVARAEHRDHVQGWGVFLPRLQSYAAELVSAA
ncbi:SRPBCC domain-containing protein [Nesterenkonia sp. HG001]|uniref:SRPBCC domain-containing protein n=1 Tax=Nesterenkonia sp. HG001 TaxID=2983207 RepID=UPI002AC63B08|nr:SRPBCC domain-containing protein [Nesterenkonia sp. HG001]MDZ5078469.1 SRPBCC domain-containing protein [Nesterenkonia sp. HG001]